MSFYRSKNGTKKLFFLIIKTKYQIYAKPIIFDLTKDDATFDPKTPMSTPMVIVGLKKSSFYPKHKQEWFGGSICAGKTIGMWVG